MKANIRKKTLRDKSRHCFFIKFNKLFVLVPLLASMLTGCSGMNGHFNCNVKAKDSCEPLANVNRLAKAGYYSHRHFRFSNDPNAQMMPRPVGYPTQSYQGQPIRTHETVQKIWVASYQDKDNNYHEPSTVFTVIKPGHWVGDPVKATT